MSDQYSYYDPQSQQNQRQHQQQQPQHQHPQQLQQQQLFQQQQLQQQQFQQFQQSQLHSQPHLQQNQNIDSHLHQSSPHGLPVHHTVPPHPNAPHPLNIADYNAQPYYDASTNLGDPHQLSDANVARWFEQDPEVAVNAPKSAVRMRRRAPAGADHIKHRRTRSGCYTCRNRRVKCDETHPICERCKKGSRDCVYPEPTSATKSTSGSKLGQSSRPGDDSGASSEEYEDDDVLESPTSSQAKVDAPGQSRSRPSASNLRSMSKKQSRSALTQGRAGSISQEHKEKSMSPSTDDTHFSRSGKLSIVSTNTSHGDSPWAHLPHDVQFYLDYHQTHLNYNYYFFKHDASHFVHDILLEIALEYDPLLYAVVGFAAYHYTIKRPNGKIADFLTFYNKSVSLLRKALQSHQKHNSATILTVLQLAAFEEYLGDWVNLGAHQKAAFEMLNELYTPENIMQSVTGRKTFAWYARFDLFAGFMAGNPPTLSVEWYRASEKYYTERSNTDPSNHEMLLESLFAIHRLLGVEMAQLFAKLHKGDISLQDFIQANTELRQHIVESRAKLNPLLESSDHRVMSFEGAPKLDPDDFVNPYQPGLMFKGPLFSANYLEIDFHAIVAMHDYQTAMILQQPPPQHLMDSALEQCRILEGIEFWPGSPNGAILPAQASLGLICLFLPRDERHSSWCRRKLAKIEANGYIYPPTFRQQMVEHWSNPSLNRWWLDSDESYPPIIKAIRAFIEERTIKPRTQVDEDLRAMKAIFSKLSYDDSPKNSHSHSPESITSSANASSSGKHEFGSPQSHTSGSQQDLYSDQRSISISGSQGVQSSYGGIEVDAATMEQLANCDVSGGFDQSRSNRPQ